jgi:hypothetical protein
VLINHLKHEIHFIVLTNSVLSKKRPNISITKNKLSLPYRHIEAVYFNSHTQSINTLCWLNKGVMNVETCVQKLATSLFNSRLARVLYQRTGPVGAGGEEHVAAVF